MYPEGSSPFLSEIRDSNSKLLLTLRFGLKLESCIIIFERKDLLKGAMMKPTVGKTVWDFACEHPIIFSVIISGLTTAAVTITNEVIKSLTVKENENEH